MEELQKSGDLFRCPVCSGTMKLENNKSLICGRGHCFDLSRKGYINFLLRPVRTEYGRAMFQARNRILTGGFFLPLAQQVCGILEKEIGFAGHRPVRILDAGCGEGTFLAQTVDFLRSLAPAGIKSIGMDISKEGIRIASGKHRGFLWCVSDLANCPFQDGKMDVVLNLLSPSNYGEFHRILADGGLLIKIVPGSDYLKELRGIFYDHTAKQTYSNEKVLRRFQDHFHLSGQERIRYSVTLRQGSLEDLIHMTPLSWDARCEKVRDVLHSGISSITVDMMVLIGKNSSVV